MFSPGWLSLQYQTMNTMQIASMARAPRPNTMRTDGEIREGCEINRLADRTPRQSE